MNFITNFTKVIFNILSTFSIDHLDLTPLLSLINPSNQNLILIFKTTSFNFIEGPHLYIKN
jgi:hypothetical protein